jgi:hypothetical protein
MVVRSCLFIPLLLLSWIFAHAASETASICSGPEQTIVRFLNTQSKGDFYIQGWRWHTMSLVHEAGRLHQLATQLAALPEEEAEETKKSPLSSNHLTDLRKATEYTVDFNMRGLHKIERDVFFPWVRAKTHSIQKEEPEVSRAFDTVLNELDQERNGLESLGSSLVSSYSFCCVSRL